MAVLVTYPGDLKNPKKKPSLKNIEGVEAFGNVETVIFMNGKETTVLKSPKSEQD
jgi:hypothetical protein